MNPNQKLMHSKNTVGYLTISKQMPIYKKTPTKTIFQNHSKTNKFIINKKNGTINQSSYLLDRYISQKRYQGVLDVASPGNKDVLIDSDSEVSKKGIKVNRNNNIKNGCAKLVIEKVESQFPQKNEEYYKFTNQKRYIDDPFINTQDSNKKHLIRLKSSILFNKTDKRQKKSYFDLIPQSQMFSNKKEKGQSHSIYQDYIKDTSKRRMFFNASATNFYKRNGNLYDIGYSYKSQHGSNNNIFNRDNNATNKSPDGYINTIEDNSNNFFYNYNNSVNDTSNQDSIYYNQIEPGKNKKIYYIHKNNNNNLYRNRDIGEESKKSTLYENYKDLIKMNTFSNLSINNNSQNTSKIILYPELKEKLIKIQSVWRGVYVRELMNFYWNLNDFKEILNKIFNNHLYNYFLSFINKLKRDDNYNSKKYFIDNNKLRQNNKNERKKIKGNDDKRLEDYIKALNQKEEDYNNLLKNYNSLVERCTELQQIINQNNESNINQIEINKNNRIFLKQFDLIQPEQKDKFDIIDYIDDNNKIKLKQKKTEKQQNEITRQLSIHYNNKENFEKYFNRFRSNSLIVNVDRFIIQETPSIKKFELQITNYELSLLNINNNKKNIFCLLEICHDESMDILYNKKKTILPIEISKNESIELISDKKQKSLIKKICNNEQICLLGNKVKQIIIEISKNESMNLLGKKFKNL